MKKENAIKKALERKSGDLPFGFDIRLMERIMLEAEKKSRRSYYLNLCLVSFVSLAMVVGSFFLMNSYLNFNIIEFVSGINLIPKESPILLFSVYIAVIILILLGIDYKLRQLVKKTH